MNLTNIKKVLIATALMATSTFSFADTAVAPKTSQSTIPAEHLSQLCVAALNSEQEYRDTARKLDISKEARNRLVCNELGLEEFTATHRLTNENTIATVQ